MSIKQANKFLFLPPANEVWGKVVFLHLCVILFTGGLGFPACITGHMTRGSASGEGLPPGGSASMGVGKTLPLQIHGILQQAGGTHRTGMYKCQICCIMQRRSFSNISFVFFS